MRPSAWRRLALACLLLAGCVPPTQRSGPGMVQLDKETHYLVESEPAGFRLTLFLDRYQFAPDLTGLGETCTQRLLTLAQELAQQQGRAMTPLTAAQVQRTVTRESRGITTCRATAPVRWKE